MKDPFNNALQEKPLVRELILAVQRERTEEVRELLQRGADIVAADKLMLNGAGSVRGTGYTAFGWAARNGSLEIAALLLKAGADINGQDKWGHTPLMHAVHNYLTGMVRFLVSRGASLEEKTHEGKTVWDVVGFETMRDILRDAVETRQRSVAAAAAVAAAKAETEAKAAWESALHNTAANRQETLKFRAPKLTIKP